MAGFPVYIALCLVMSITPLLNVHPRTAALRERGGRGWFGQVSQESAGGNGSRLGGEREGTVWEQAATPRCTGTGPSVPPLPPINPPFQQHPGWRRDLTMH